MPEPIPQEKSNGRPSWGWIAQWALGICSVVVCGIGALISAMIWDLHTDLKETKAVWAASQADSSESLAKVNALRIELDWRVRQADSEHARFVTRLEVEKIIRDTWQDFSRRESDRQTPERRELP